MSKHYSLMLAGPDTEMGRREVFSPYSSELLATVAQCGEPHIDAAFELAYETYKDRDNWQTVSQRAAILERTADIMSTQIDELAGAAAAEGGKPLMDSLVEVRRAIAGVRMCAEHINAHAGEVIPLSEAQPQTARIGFTQKEPVGVVVAVSAFNHPLNLIVHQVGAAVAAGCPVLVKPSNDTPLSCFRFVQILREAGLPEAWCQVVIPKSTELSTRLVSDPRVAFFSFIGSAGVGWMLRSKLAPGTRCALEHGGVAPVIIDETAALDKAIPAILKGGFYHAGQVCVSVQRVYVPDAMLDAFASRLVEGAEQLKVGDPLNPEVEVGPLIRSSEVDRIDAWIQTAIEQGATALCGAKRLDNNCYAPTVLLNPPADAEVSVNEIFGPLVCLYSYRDVQEAINAANSLDVAFQAAIFAQDVDRAVALYHQLDASAVMLNDHTAFRQDNMPFAGLKHAGLGVGGISHTIEDMQIDKMLVIKAASKL